MTSPRASNPFDWTAAYPSPRAPVFARQVVSTSHPLAAQHGLRVLAEGGNAIDAAICAAATMTIAEPCSNGLGSDLFAIVWDGTALHGLNASGTAPAAWTPAYFRRLGGEDARTPPKRGWGSVTVPGAVAGWVELHRRFGSKPLARLLGPAAEAAERGIAVPPVIAHKWAGAAALPELTSQPGFAEAFLQGPGWQGRAPRVGERFVLPGAARTLRAIADTAGDHYYRGEVAAAAEAHAKAHGGAITAADFAAYAPEWVGTIAHPYRGHVLHEIPPNGQGLAALIALGILEHFELASMPVDGPQKMHLQIEAMKLAFADVYAHVADARAMRVGVGEMLDPAYLKARAALIDPRRAQPFFSGFGPRGGTIYLTAADTTGRMVSLIQSNYMGFGSGIVLPEHGVSFQNRGQAFTLDEAHANVVAPGKRPFHTIIPAFLTDADGAPRMSFGVMGGDMQPQGHLQTLSRMLDHRQNPQAACDAPRWRVAGGVVNCEAHMPAATVQGLVDLGHRVEGFSDSYQDYGAGQFIWRLGDPAVEGYAAASDPRRDGAAAGL
jgi:gamma-glutamyltranspeptidase/glutathione hydrolase